MFVFGGYIDMRGATNELWQYELGESVSTVSSLLTTVFESALSMLRGFSGLSRLIIQQKNPNFVWVLLIQSCCDCGDSIFLRKGRFSFFFIYLFIFYVIFCSMASSRKMIIKIVIIFSRTCVAFT